jgi:hypothetical protein
VRHAFRYGDNGFSYGEYCIAITIHMAENILLWRILSGVVENVWRKLFSYGDIV